MQGPPQLGQRAVSVAVDWMMASIHFMKNTDTPRLLLVGLLLPSVLVPSAGAQTTSIPSTTGAIITTTTTVTSGSTNTQPSTVTTTSSTANQGGSSAQPATAPASTTAGVSMTMMTNSATTMASSSWTSPNPTQSPLTGSVTATMTTVQTSSTGGMMMMNGTTTSNGTSMNMQLYCPSFTCNYSDCYTMYSTQNATACTSESYCQLLRPMEMCYTVGCSAMCAETCFNASQTNCSVTCCNTTGCLNDTFASMMMTTTMASTMTTKPPTAAPATTTTQATTADTGKKCHNGTCTGETCYTGFKNQGLQTCSGQQPHCQLKKETVGSTTTWMAGCTNCTNVKACKTSTAMCNLECCNATMTSSCLLLNGTLNVPSYAARGPHIHTELLASILGLLAFFLLL